MGKAIWPEHTSVSTGAPKPPTGTAAGQREVVVISTPLTATVRPALARGSGRTAPTPSLAGGTIDSGSERGTDGDPGDPGLAPRRRGTADEVLGCLQ